MNQPFSSNALFRTWLSYKGTNTGWDGSLVAGIDSDIPMPIPGAVVAGGTLNPLSGLIRTAFSMSVMPVNSLIAGG